MKEAAAKMRKEWKEWDFLSDEALTNFEKFIHNKGKK